MDAAIGARGRILYVEDHADTLALTTRLLRLNGYDVTPASSGEAALAAAGEQGFDVGLFDISLPDMTGNELLRRLGDRRPVRCVAVTGHDCRDHDPKFEHAAFDACLTKPFGLEDLLVVVRRSLVCP